MKSQLNKPVITYLMVGVTLCIAVFLTMFQSWEMGGESWGYWYFARVFSETGKFIVLDRSPLYILILNLFSWMPYPYSVTVEYFVITTFTVGILFLFFRTYIGIWLALFAACIWLPYLQTSEPPVQKLALAFSLIAVMIRRNNEGRLYITSSYAFLMLAYQFRQIYIFMLILFIILDIINVLRKNGMRSLFSFRPKPAYDWPIYLPIGLFAWFYLCQSTSSWNNVYLASTTWFPGSGKSMLSAVQAFNWLYIELKYGTFIGHDFYFTNKEAFFGSTSIPGMFFANPHLFLEIILSNIRSVVPLIMVNFVWIPKTGIQYFDYLMFYVMFIGIIYGAFRASKDKLLLINVTSSLLLIAATVIAVPQLRYIVPMIPVFVTAAFWWGTKISNIIRDLHKNDKTLLRNGCFLSLFFSLLFLFIYFTTDSVQKPARSAIIFAAAIIAILFALLLFLFVSFSQEKPISKLSSIVLKIPIIVLLCWFSSINVIDWYKIFANIVNDLKAHELRLLQNRDGVSMKSSYAEMSGIIKNTKGIIALESTFLGAFSNLPQNRIHDVWEIPPFGSLKNSMYKGLNPEKIDCVFLPKGCENIVGKGTNYQLRYLYYLKPYVSYLNSLGAVTYEINNYGQIVILQK